MTAGLIALVIALYRGEFGFGFDDFSQGIPITRRDNPWGYWIGIACFVALLVTLGFIIAANYGIDIALPKLRL
jgi:hypothetical protein